MQRRVVITGLGIYSCIGQSVDSVLYSLQHGKSGIGMMPERAEYGYHSALSGIVPLPDLRKLLDRRQRVSMSQEAEFAFMATKDALFSAGLSDSYIASNPVGVIFGNDSSADAIIRSGKVIDQKHDTAMIGAGAVFQSINSTVTMNLSTVFHLSGISFTVSAACASGNHSVGVASMFIRNGLQDVIICGAAQEVNLNSSISFDALGVFSKFKGNPEQASRPFDSCRDGLVPSGGAAAVILEDLDHALRRGAKIYAEVVGYGFSSNGCKITQPSVAGEVSSMEMALRSADLRPQDISYINAHATSTPDGDASEAVAICSLFGENSIPVSSTKSMTGHECWMSGVSEIVYSTLMLNNDFIAPNINFCEGDQYTNKLNVVTTAQEAKLTNILSNSFGFGGTNATIIITKYNN